MRDRDDINLYMAHWGWEGRQDIVAIVCFGYADSDTMCYGLLVFSTRNVCIPTLLFDRLVDNAL
jgi:hypothetical protein